MRILVTGANGKIGQKLIEKLESSQDDLIVLVRNRENVNFENVEIQEGDLSDKEKLDAIILNIDIIFHLAAITHANDVDAYMKTNLQGTKNLLASAEKNKVKKFVYISSRSASRDGGAYAFSKLLAEEEVEKYKFQWLIFSLAEVYGVNENEAITKLINYVKHKKYILIPGKGNYKLSPIFVGDVVGVLRDAAKSEIVNKKYVLAGGTEYSFEEIVDLVARLLNKKIIKIHIPIRLISALAKVLTFFGLNIIAKDQVARFLTKKPSSISLVQQDYNFYPQNFENWLKNFLKF